MAIISKYPDWTRGQVEALLNILGEENAKKLLAGKAKVSIEEIVETLLEFAGTTIVFAATEPFDAVKKFVVNTAPDAELPISYLGGNFKTLRDQVGVEQPATETQLRQQKLLRSSVDGSILQELGGLEKAQILFQTTYNFLKTADRGKWYIFYVYGWAVYALWYDDGWPFHASSLENPCDWGAGCVVVSRD